MPKMPAKLLKGFPPTLSKPIVIDPEKGKKSILSAGSPEAQLQAFEDNLKQQKGNAAIDFASKILLIAKHYQLDIRAEDFWEMLSKKLLQEFVPGFRIDHKQTKVGPKKKWDDQLSLLLYLDMRATNKPDYSAFAILAKRVFWQKMLKVGSNKPNHDKLRDALNKQYQKSKDQPMIKAAKIVLDTGNPELCEPWWKYHEDIKRQYSSS